VTFFWTFFRISYFLLAQIWLACVHRRDPARPKQAQNTSKNTPPTRTADQRIGYQRTGYQRTGYQRIGYQRLGYQRIGTGVGALIRSRFENKRVLRDDVKQDREKEDDRTNNPKKLTSGVDSGLRVARGCRTKAPCRRAPLRALIFGHPALEPALKARGSVGALLLRAHTGQKLEFLVSGQP